MAWMEADYSKHTYFLWKVKWRLEHLGTLGIMGETALSPDENVDTETLLSTKFPLHSPNMVHDYHVARQG